VADGGQGDRLKLIQQIGISAHGTGMKAHRIGTTAEPQQGGTARTGAHQFTNAGQRQALAVLEGHGGDAGWAAVFLRVLLNAGVTWHESRRSGPW
jgi:hypothetical protein